MIVVPIWKPSWVVSFASLSLSSISFINMIFISVLKRKSVPIGKETEDGVSYENKFHNLFIDFPNIAQLFAQWISKLGRNTLGL